VERKLGRPDRSQRLPRPVLAFDVFLSLQETGMKHTVIITTVVIIVRQQSLLYLRCFYPRRSVNSLSAAFKRHRLQNLSYHVNVDVKVDGLVAPSRKLTSWLHHGTNGSNFSFRFSESVRSKCS
jgi:hypothetical protein